MAVLGQSGSSVVGTVSSISINGYIPNLYGRTIAGSSLSITFLNAVTLSNNATLTLDKNIQQILTPLSPNFGIGNYLVSGTVKNGSNIGLSRLVVAFSRLTNYPLNAVYSSSTTGEFTLNVPNEDVYVVCIPNDGDNVNAEIYDKITPVASI